jgi:hypothetical protein
VDIGVSRVPQVGSWITLHAMDDFAKTEGLASLTTVGSNPYVSVEPDFEITETDIDSEGHIREGSALQSLQSQLSVRVEVASTASLAEVRSALPMPTADNYNFLCKGRPVHPEDEAAVHVCDVAPVRPLADLAAKLALNARAVRRCGSVCALLRRRRRCPSPHSSSGGCRIGSPPTATTGGCSTGNALCPA